MPQLTFHQNFELWQTANMRQIKRTCSHPLQAMTTYSHTVQVWPMAALCAIPLKLSLHTVQDYECGGVEGWGKFTDRHTVPDPRLDHFYNAATAHCAPTQQKNPHQLYLMGRKHKRQGCCLDRMLLPCPKWGARSRATTNIWRT